MPVINYRDLKSREGYIGILGYTIGLDTAWMILLLYIDPVSRDTTSAGEDLAEKIRPLCDLPAHCRDLYAVSAGWAKFTAGAWGYPYSDR